MGSHCQGEVLNLGGWESGAGRWYFVPVDFELLEEYPVELCYRPVEIEHRRLVERLGQEIEI